MFRIGHGYDTHRFEVGKKLILGGVIIPSEKGMKAHSDGDVVLHAITDALLGAAGLGDIGQHFPDTDKQYVNIDSRILLRHIVNLITSNYRINNVDVTILAEVPRISPYIQSMRENIAEDLNLSAQNINIKATTTEKMGFIGREEGIASYAVVLIQKFKN